MCVCGGWNITYWRCTWVGCLWARDTWWDGEPRLGWGPSVPDVDTEGYWWPPGAGKRQTKGRTDADVEYTLVKFISHYTVHGLCCLFIYWGRLCILRGSHNAIHSMPCILACLQHSPTWLHYDAFWPGRRVLQNCLQVYTFKLTFNPNT